MDKVLAVVVLYHPDQGIADRIQTYLPDVARLLVIDNTVPSSPIARQLQQRWPSIDLIANGINKGSAGALNQAVEYARAQEFEWLLAMDQDSSFDPGGVRKMKESLHTMAKDVAVVAPSFRTPDEVLPLTTVDYTDIRFTMTSGSMLRIKAATRCGSFLEKLFIDSVDHEYCLRVRRMGYRIIRVNQAVLQHDPGTPAVRKFLFWRVSTTHHPAERKYYMTRNRLFVISRYLGFDARSCGHEFKHLTKSLAGILLFEEEKIKKLKATFVGAWHFAIGRYGEYPAGKPRVAQE
jgi:rhamnosyltransferase